MKRQIYLAAALFALMTAPALAGTATFTDGSGAWRSTGCKPPSPPAAYSYDPEVAADNLNATMQRNNAYVDAVHDYMDCVSKEAQKDAEEASKMIIDAAKADIDAIQKQAEAVQTRLPVGPQPEVKKKHKR